MKKEIIIIKNRNKKIKLIVENCNFLDKFIGLMFSNRTKAKILLFHFEKKQKIRIHSLFVFFPFLAVWLDEKNKITDLKIVRPFSFCISHKKTACNLVEIPLNLMNKNIIKSFLPTRRKV